MTILKKKVKSILLIYFRTFNKGKMSIIIRSRKVYTIGLRERGHTKLKILATTL